MSDEPTYEKAREQLTEVVRELESGNVPLSRSLELWERGEKLAAVCQRWLDGAKAKIAEAEKLRTD
ncbi:exodeoxyribonuclease VII small subunit [Nigerium sp.]|uniref:exodeoxyribonuclease VII small subunit n=1 Tax=Nigerium sp. TaxID=2042655 RepID=UPI003221AE93